MWCNAGPQLDMASGSICFHPNQNASRLAVLSVGLQLCVLLFYFFPFRNQSIHRTHGTVLHFFTHQSWPICTTLYLISFITCNGKLYSFNMSCFSCLVNACWQWSEVLRCDCVNVTFSWIYESVVTPRSAQQSALSIISGPLTPDRKHSDLRLTDGRWADQGQGHTCCCSGAGSRFTILDKTQIMQRKVSAR